MSEKKDTVRHFMNGAPVSESKQVFNDMSVLLGDDSALENEYGDVFEEYNSKHLVPVTDEEGSTYLVSKYGKLSSNEFTDCRKGVVITVNHIEKTVTEKRDMSDDEKIPSDLDEWRKPMQSSLDSYIQDAFPSGIGVVYPVVGDPHKLVLCISSPKESAENFWSGSWRSIWMMTLGNGSVLVEGTIHCNVHLYEDGNVQLSSADKQKKEIETTASRCGDDVIEFVRKCDTTFHQKVEEGLKSMSGTTFKALRRNRQVSGEPFDFASASHRVAAELSCSRR